MRLRFKKEKNNRGIVVLESEPQFRTLIHNGNRFTQRVSLPYLYFIVRYEIRDDGSYLYGGYGEHGLRVFCRNTPLKSMVSTLSLLPTDEERSGLVCTEHKYDYTTYRTLPELTSKAIGLWYGHNHSLAASGHAYEWYKKSLEEVVKVKWTKYRSLRRILAKHDRIPLLAMTTNKPWPPK